LGCNRTIVGLKAGENTNRPSTCKCCNRTIVGLKGVGMAFAVTICRRCNRTIVGLKAISTMETQLLAYLGLQSHHSGIERELLFRRAVADIQVAIAP